MRRGEDFQATVRRGRKGRASSVMVHLDVPADAEQALGAGARGDIPVIGFVVTKAIGPAVVRNRVKRQLRHLMRSRLHEVPPGTRLVVRALPSSASRARQDIAADLDRALSQASA
jgi:ribonuclease P protein component